MVIDESDLSDNDERKPLVSSSRIKKQSAMSTHSNTSNQSDEIDESDLVEKWCSHMPDDYRRKYLKALKLIDVDIPTLITGGSSGSYLIHGDNNEILGVFKPEDEEPYGINNPKWGKWFQKVFLPCSFGRGCLVPNQGYVSEAAAYVVDQFFQLNIVPPTAVVSMASKVFNYSKIKRAHARVKQRLTSQYPNLQNRFNWSKVYKNKRGSFQLFVKGFMDSEDFNREYPIETLTEADKLALTLEIQKMFVLDFMIRNTDRLNANYMIKVVEFNEPVVKEHKEEPKEVIIDIVSESDSHNKIVIKTDTGETYTAEESSESTKTVPETHATIPTINIEEVNDDKPKKSDRTFTIACIDNGLAFPFKHPSDIRSYPFSWARYFPYFANQPFSPEIKQAVLPVLQNIDMVKVLCEKVEEQLKIQKHYRQNSTVKSQLSVFRGQMYNLMKALENNLTPAHLETKTPCYAKELKRKKSRPAEQQEDNSVPVDTVSDNESVNSVGPRSPSVELWRSSYKIRKHNTNPYLSCF